MTESRSTPPWSDYQEDVAAFLRELGLEATTNERVQGVRGTHTVDVIVRGEFAGIDIMWLVECKRWNRPVRKANVLTFLQIVSDVGANLGLFMAEAGYQKGAVKSVTNTSVLTTSLVELRSLARPHLQQLALADLQQRFDRCADRVRRYMVDTHRSKRFARSRSLQGAGDVVPLYGQLAAVERGLEAARNARLPAVYALDLTGGNGQPLVANTTNELLEGMNVTLERLEQQCDAIETAIAEGPDAHLLTGHGDGC